MSDKSKEWTPQQIADALNGIGWDGCRWHFISEPYEWFVGESKSGNKRLLYEIDARAVVAGELAKREIDRLRTQLTDFTEEQSCGHLKALQILNDSHQPRCSVCWLREVEERRDQLIAAVESFVGYYDHVADDDDPRFEPVSVKTVETAKMREVRFQRHLDALILRQSRRKEDEV